MRTVDTNLVVRLIVRDDPRQVAAAERFVAQGAWVSLLVLREVMWVLDRAYGVSFPDCLIVASARASGHTPLSSFDRRLARFREVQSVV
ncbi:MAG: hypothetical protein IT349_08865 [Candidatus Eisenbacteria bacterium]|nr:hypothetical protein [Candidatus Eisenbacteria bacterium]MCC7142197.1 hypothetical protein [Candidatus Eisenbacteria bacterium]